MAENTSNFADIKKDFYPFPTQVRWGEMDDDGQLEEYFGIAYQDKVICGCCGEPIDLNEDYVYIFEELEWVDIADAIEGT